MENQTNNPRFIPFLSGEVGRCQDFAEKVDKTTDYLAERDQTNSPRRIRQQRDGKLGELVVYRHLSGRGFKFEKSPDFTIYTDGEKSWQSDLVLLLPEFDKTMRLAVKSQNDKAKKDYGCSWLFNYADKNGVQGPSHTDDLFYPEHQGGLIVVVSIVGNGLYPDGGQLQGAVRPKAVMAEVEKSLTVVPKLHKSKRVLYEKYLQTLPEDVRWRWPFDLQDPYQEAILRIKS
jgi:hypothetical protein